MSARRRALLLTGATASVLIVLVLALVLFGRAAHYVSVFDLGEFVALEGDASAVRSILDVEVQKTEPRVPLPGFQGIDVRIATDVNLLGTACRPGDRLTFSDDGRLRKQTVAEALSSGIKYFASKATFRETELLMKVPRTLLKTANGAAQHIHGRPNSALEPSAPAES